MKIYVDADYRCHVADDGTMRPFEVPEFDGKCSEFIEGYRYVPGGEAWQRKDGVVFEGEMFSPWKDYTQLHIAQLEYELADADAALRELGVMANG